MAAPENVVVKKAAPAAKKATHPTYLEMAKDAIVSLGDKKGASVPAIQSFIAGKHAIDPDTVRVHLKAALAKGLENGTFERPKNSDAKGFTGRFKLNKEKATGEEKAKKQKEKEKVAKEKKKEKEATNKPVKKTGAASKSPAKKKKATDNKPKKTAAKKKATPLKKATTKKAGETKPKAAKAKLKTPKKTPKTLKVATSAKK